jgi:ribonuclease M5
MEILLAENLSGCSQAAQRRRTLGKILGIGYGNSHRFLEKLNGFHVQKEEFYEALRTIQHQEDSSGK